MKTLSWILLILLSISLGALTVYYLVAPPIRMGLFLTLTILVIVSLVLLFVRNFHSWQFIAGGILILIIGFLAGYMAANTYYLSQEEERILPTVTRATDDKGLGHLAIVYFTHGEPPAYSAMPWIETFRELDADNAPFIPVPFRPFFLKGLRDYYLKAGGSPHNKIHQVMIDSLEKRFREEHPDTPVRFYLAFLDSNPRPDEMMTRALNEGASQVIVMPVFLTESSHTQAGREMVEALNVEQYDIPICYTKPLWESDALRQMYVARADHRLGGFDRSKVGVLLVGHGQPARWDELYPTQTTQEISFREAVRQRFIQAGYLPENVSLAWMEFKTPAVPEKALELANQGIEKLLVIPASISADSIHSDIQVPEEVEEAHLPESLEIIHLGSWGNDLYLIQTLTEQIAACLKNNP